MELDGGDSGLLVELLVVATNGGGGKGRGDRAQGAPLPGSMRRRLLRGPAGLAGAMDEGSMSSGRRPSAGEEAVKAG